MANSDKTLIIHGGLPKTGTSSIQWALNQNRNVLAEYGVLYPSFCDGVGDTLRRMIRHGQVTSPRAGGETYDVEQVVEGVLNEFMESPCQYAIISDEALSNFSIKDWQRLGLLFQSVKVHLVFTVRDPYAHTVSVIQQCLKSGVKNLSEHYKKPRFYPLENLIERARYGFPYVSISVVSFEVLCRSNSTILESFLSESGLELAGFRDITEGHGAIVARNSSMTQQGAWTLDALNRLECPDGVSELRWTALCHQLCGKLGGSKFTVTRACSEIIIDYAKHESQSLNEFLGGQIYDPRQYNFNKIVPCEELWFEAEYFDSIARCFHEQIEKEFKLRASHSALISRFENLRNSNKKAHTKAA